MNFTTTPADVLPPTLEPIETDEDDRDGPSVHAGITAPDGTVYSAHLHLPPDTPPGHIATALVAVLNGAASTHSRMLAAMVQDALTAGLRFESEGLTVAKLDAMAAEHQRTAGHVPHLLEVPGIGSVPFTTVRAVLAMAGHH